jgi:hypothetical protein
MTFFDHIFCAVDVILTSVVDPHHLDADPDLTYHPDADPDSDFFLMRVRIFVEEDAYPDADLDPDFYFLYGSGFYFMQIRIRADPDCQSDADPEQDADPDPQHYSDSV